MRKKTELNLEEILTDKAVVNDILEVPVPNGIFRACFAAATLLVFVALAHLVFLNVVKGEFYRQRALTNISEIAVQKAERGVIYDRYGKPLATNKPTFNAILTPTQLPREEKERKNVLEKSAQIASRSAEDLEKEIQEKTSQGSNSRILLKRDLPPSQAVILQNENLPGLIIENNWQRNYTNPSIFSHLLGYIGLADKNDLTEHPDWVSDELTGKSGLESFYDNLLRGKNGRTINFRNVRGEILAEALAETPKIGQSLTTFIDAEFQEYLYNRLQRRLNDLGRQIGLGLAMNPQNGEVLALASIPGFDGNRVADFLAKPDQPFFNRVIAGLYSPGSTIKPLVAAAGLQEKIVDTKTEVFSAGSLKIPNPYHPEQPSVFLDWKAHGWVNLYSALARSSNIFFYVLGGGLPSPDLTAIHGQENIKGLGFTKLRDYWRLFGLGESSGIDLTGEKTGSLPETTIDWRLGDVYNMSIGQGDLLVTPIQLLSYINAVINGGKLWQPRLAEKEPKLLNDLSEMKDVLTEVKKGMIDATQKPYGTAFLLNDLPITVAAKTGTAQTNNNTKINALFVGGAPAENPQFSLLLLIENAREGSSNAVPIAKDIFQWYYENRLKK